MNGSDHIPTVSIGLPVFNGENFVAEAIGSVLAQTFEDFELVICDNASTDRTEEICRELAGNDRRVLYFRNARNLGAAPNYNLTYAKARGRYFKWLSHDDRILPGFLAATVEALEERPAAVLCSTVARFIDQDGVPIGEYDSALVDARGDSPAARFAALVLLSHPCVDFFGLIRREALQSSLLHASFHGADRALLAQLALRGRFVQLGEPLIEMREHSHRCTRSLVRSTDRLAWHDAALRNRASFPTWHLYGEYLKMVRTERLSAAERLACRAVLAQWWFRNWNALRAAVDVLAVIAPATPGFAERLKTRLFGAAPGHFIADRRR